jgi:20S proteasome subunit beta 5
MLSDLIDLDELLENTAFDNGEAKPFHPYEQLMACLPPSSSYLLPKPYQWLMKSSQSPIIDFYPQSFTVDMNGKRWPWEAVVLLPFIDSKRLLDASKNFVTEDALTSDEKERNQLGTPVVYNRDESCNTHVKAIGNEKIFGEMKNCKVRETNICNSIWGHDVTDETKAIFRPELLAGCEIPAPGFPTLKDAPIKGLSRRRLGIDVFGMRSRYRTAVLELDDELPMVTSAQALSKKFIGNTVYFRYPFLHEGFVTAVSDEETTIRGNDAARAWTKEESRRWTLSNDTVETLFETGEGLTGSGGWSIPKSFVTLSIRPLKEIQTLPDGSKVKVYARLEVQLPLAAVLWSPSRPPPYASFPARLEENPYKFRIGSMLPSLMTDKSKPGKKNQPWSGKKNQPWSGKKNQLWKGKPTPMGKRFLPDEINGPLPRKIDLLPPLKHGVLNGIGKSKRKFHSCVNLPKSSWKTELLPIRGRQRNTRTGIVTTIAAGLVAFLSTSVQADFNLHHNHNLQMLSASQAIVRGGSLENGNILNGDDQLLASNDSSVPSLEFAHGTTTLSFIFDGGIVVAVDSRASIGNFVGSKTTQKVLPINNSMLGTMAGGAADCSFWIRRLQAEARLFELSEGRCIPVSRASRILADALYTNRELGLSVGTMIMGFDDESGPSIFYIDNSGTRIKGDLFAVGSGSTFALGVLDTERRSSMKEEEALSLGITAIRHATFRDAFSGGYIAVYIINKDGWRKAFSEDLAMSGETNINRTFLHDDN